MQKVTCVKRLNALVVAMAPCLCDLIVENGRRARLLTIDTMIEGLLEDHQGARLLTSIEEIGTTAAVPGC